MTPSKYAIHKNGTAQISQCMDHVFTLNRLYQDLTVSVLSALKDPHTEKIAACCVIEDTKHIQGVGDIVAVHFESVWLINTYRCTLPT